MLSIARTHDPLRFLCAALALKSGRPESIERYIPELGAWFNIRAIPLLDASGRVALVLEQLQNIDERKRAEDELRFQALLLGQIQDMITATDLDGRITYVNEAVCNSFGVKKEDLIGRRVQEYGEEPAQGATQDEIIRETMIRGAWRGQVVNHPVDGREIILDCRTRLVRNASSRPVGMIGVSTDITHRVKAEEALRESEVRFRQLFDLIPDIVIVHHEGVVEFLNQTALNTIGADSSRQLHGKPIMELVHPDDRSAVKLRMRQLTLRGGPNDSFEQRLMKMDGRHIVMDAVSALILLDNKPYIITVGRDITESKILSSEKQKLEAELRQAHKMEAVGTLAGGIAHDFNNLIQAINGYAQILMFDLVEGDRGFKELKEIQNAGNRAKQLIRQLLTFSRKVGSDRRQVDLNQEIENISRLLERTIPRMISIELHFADGLWMVNADPVQIEQILLNLGVNAADAMPDGGTLVIETENKTLTEEYERSHPGAKPGNYVLMTVNDTGCGMAEEIVEHIFEPFFTTKDMGKGTGLGLASVYGIVKSYGGYIMCYSEIGQGTAFKIYLPAIERADRPAMTNSPIVHSSGRGETILVVDDEASIREYTSTVLTRFGYQVITCDSGEEALERVAQNDAAIDLIILDLGMPGMGGHRCLQNMLAHDPSLKVIIASGYSAHGPVKKTIDSGAVGFIAKPFQVEELLQIIWESLG